VYWLSKEFDEASCASNEEKPSFQGAIVCSFAVAAAAAVAAAVDAGLHRCFVAGSSVAANPLATSQVVMAIRSSLQHLLGTAQVPTWVQTPFALVAAVAAVVAAAAVAAAWLLPLWRNRHGNFRHIVLFVKSGTFDICRLCCCVQVCHAAF